MAHETKIANNWASQAHTILSVLRELTDEEKILVERLLCMIEDKDSISYRKLHILAMLKCNANTEDVISYLEETSSMYPHKPLIYNNFFIYADSKYVDVIFRKMASKIGYFIWSDEALQRITKIVDGKIGTSENSLCSVCNCTIPKKRLTNYSDFLNVWMKNITNKRYRPFELDKKFRTWLNNINKSELDYTVVIDGANVGRLVRSKDTSLSTFDINNVIKYFTDNGEKPIVVLNEIHKNTYEGDKSNIIWSPRYINDDICWMALALMKPGCIFVSGDKCSDWKYILESSSVSIEIRNNFKVWYETYKRNIYHMKGQVFISSAKEYSENYFEANGHYHLPIKNNLWLCWK